MNGLLTLVPIALALGFAGLAAFLWALHSGQFEDLEGAAGRILFDEEDGPGSPNSAVADPSQRRDT